MVILYKYLSKLSVLYFVVCGGNCAEFYSEDKYSFYVTIGPNLRNYHKLNYLYCRRQNLSVLV
jgi:hypothetical protein